MTRLKTSSVFLKSSRFKADWVNTMSFFSRSSNLLLDRLHGLIPIGFIERCTSIDFVHFITSHVTRACLGEEDSRITPFTILPRSTQFTIDKLMIALGVDFL